MRTEEQAFRDEIDGWVTTAFHSGHNDFGQLVRHMHGVYPLDVLDSIRRLSPIEPRLWQLLKEWNVGPDAELLSDSGDVDWLPLPHPAEFDWRFRDSAKQILVSTALHRCCSPGSICVLGAPSLTPHLLAAFPQARLKVLDANELVVEAIRKFHGKAEVMTVDLVSDEPLPSGNTAELVIADPPWYMNEMKAFLWSASQVCAQHGSLLCSFPARGTRPNAAGDCNELLNYAEEIGFAFCERYPESLRYDSPLFERNAIRAAGMSSVPWDWRAGDLVVFSKSRQNYRLRSESGRRSTWMEIRFGKTRLKVRKKQSAGTDPRLRTLLPGDILDSVSQRDPRVPQIDVWTSGNRVFSCDSTERFAAIALTLYEPHEPASDQTQEVRDQLTKLIATEASES